MSSNNKRPAPSSAEQRSDVCTLKKGKGAFDIAWSDPVLELTMTATAESIDAIDPSSPTLLQDMLGPLPRDYFLHNLFRKKAVYIAGSASHYVQQIVENYMFNLDMKYVLEETSSDNVFVWLAAAQNGGNDGKSKGAIRSIEVSDPGSALALYECGHATYCRAPPELEQPLVSSLLRDTGLGCGQYDPSGERSTVLGRGEVEVFAAGKAGHTTDWHTDFQENFTIQLSGQKRWTLKQGRATHPLRGCTPHYRSPDSVEGQLKSARLSAPHFKFAQPDETNSFGTEESVLLKPGDVFYFPAGMWHKVETVEAGVSINVSLMATNYASIFCQSLQHLLLKHDGWREAVANVDDCSAADKLQSLLSTLPDILANLQDNGGARAILPPVLLRPPQFEVIGGDNDSEGEEKNIDEEGVVESMDEVAAVDATSNASAESSEGNLDIVHCDAFEVPKDAQDDIAPAASSDKDHKLVKNPLASLMLMKDITSYYADSEKEDESNMQRGDERLYVLNINFAGNEVHESSVRTIVKAGSMTSDEILSKCCSCEKSGKDPAELVQKLTSKPIPCLLYYGYFIWKELD